MKKYCYGLLYGRFQPFHNGHLYLIKKTLEKVGKLIIAIGSANVYDENNPIKYKDRYQMLVEVVKQEKLENRIIKIIGLDDFYDDDLWFKNILKTIVSDLDVVIGNNEWSNKIFEKHNIPVIRIKYYRRNLYEGWRIRKLIRDKSPWQKRMPKYIAEWLNDYMVKAQKTKYKYSHVALGGTFDHFHIGHEELINTAFKIAENIFIGITNDEMNKNKTLSMEIEKLEVRQEKLEKYLKEKNYLSRSKIYVLHDIFGPTITDGTIEAIIVSKQTFSNANKINTERMKRNLPKMDIVLVDDVKGRDKKIVSSERIRAGEIDRFGKSIQYSVFGIQHKMLILPENLREKLRIPLGKVITTTKEVVQSTCLAGRQVGLIKPTMTIAVGDIVSMSLIKAGIQPDIAIIDYRSRRETILNDEKNIRLDYDRSQVVVRKSVNKARTINIYAVKEINNSINDFLFKKKKQILIIKGEEDLLALPAILLAPLGSVVLYGQYGLGVVMVEVTEEMKNKVEKILKKFID